MAPKAKTKPALGGQQQQPAGAKGGVAKISVTTAPPAVASGPSIEELFKTLSRHVKNDEFKQVVKVADEILQLSPGDMDAVECKVVAYIQLDEFDEALVVIDSAAGLDLTFQKAYCLYKRNRIQEALNALKNVERNANMLQLEAQILFKLGNFNACINSYHELLHNHKIDSDEVKSNLIAAYVSGGRSRDVPGAMSSIKVSPRNNFNLAYNAACALIESEEFAKAEENLLLARRIGQESLIEDEYPEEEIEDELAPISVQLSYVHQVLGRSAEALEGYNTLIKKKPADESSMAVASNNLIALRGARELFDALKKFDKLFEKKTVEQKLQFTEKLDQRLSLRQKEAICFNRFLLLLHSNKLDQARDLVPSLLDSFPYSETPAMLAAALALKEGKPARAEDVLEQYAAKHPKNSKSAYLVRAQVSASSGNYARAAESLEKIIDLQHRPGMVATLVTLKEKAGDVTGAEAVLDSAVQWWDNHMGGDDTTSETLIQEAAAFKLKHNKLDNAAKLFQRLTKSSSPAVRAEAWNGLVRSMALSDPTKAELFEKQLTPLPGLKKIDVEALERAAPTTSKRARAADEEAKTGDERADKIKPKKKRKRKPLYPKNYDPANPGPPPDPERWLPKRERSSFRPKKKDKRAQQQQIRGAQGSARGDSAASNGLFHTSSGTAKSGSGAASSANKSPTPTVAAPEPPKPSASGHKNKKKGRR